MPGIAGIISKSYGEKRRNDLGFMIEQMVHEPFYVTGSYMNDQMGLFAGWVCIKGSFSDCMPVFNEKKDICLLFSGENFTDRETLDSLRSRGHEIDSENAGYIVHLYEERGEDFLLDLNGQYAGILIDIGKGKGILFNDRYGIERIYYHEDKEAFYFSSEAKSLLRIMPGLRRLNEEALGQFFSLGCVLNDRTLFPNISLLPAGSAWGFSRRGLDKKHCYFKRETWENQSVLDKEPYYRKLRSTFLRILPRYFSMKAPVAMSLTGGLDTRMILANIDLSQGKLPCYTFGGMYRDCFDVIVARKIADAVGKPHHVIRVDQGFLSNFQALAEKTVYLTDGCMDVTGAPDLYVNKLARDIAPVRITGNYGSEVFRSVSSFKPRMLSDLIFDQGFNKHVKAAGMIFENEASGNRLSFLLFKGVPRFQHGRLKVEQSQLTQRTPFLDYDLVKVVYQAMPEAIKEDDISRRLISDGNPALGKFKTDRGIGGNSNPLVSLWTRFYREFTFKADFAYGQGMPQWIAKIDHAFSPLHLEKIFLGRHKFYHFRVWYRRELADYIKDILLDKKTTTRAFLNGRFIEAMIQQHVKGTRNYTTEIHKVLTAELIHRTLLESY